MPAVCVLAVLIVGAGVGVIASSTPDEVGAGTEVETPAVGSVCVEANTSGTVSVNIQPQTPINVSIVPVSSAGVVNTSINIPIGTPVKVSSLGTFHLVDNPMINKAKHPKKEKEANVTIEVEGASRVDDVGDQSGTDNVSKSGNIEAINDSVEAAVSSFTNSLVARANVRIGETTHNVTIEKSSETLVLSSNGVAVNTSLSIELGEGICVRIGDEKKEIRVLPDMLPGLNEMNVKHIELKNIRHEPVYEIKAAKEVRVLGIFPTSIDVDVYVNANTGEVVVEKPWWSVFCLGW